MSFVPCFVLHACPVFCLFGRHSFTNVPKQTPWHCLSVTSDGCHGQAQSKEYTPACWAPYRILYRILYRVSASVEEEILRAPSKLAHTGPSWSRRPVRLPSRSLVADRCQTHARGSCPAWRLCGGGEVSTEEYRIAQKSRTIPNKRHLDTQHGAWLTLFLYFVSLLSLSIPPSTPTHSLLSVPCSPSFALQPLDSRRFCNAPVS